jgi:phytoene dehydrogenase-like protein
VLVLEANDDIGGLTVTQEITRPGFHSDLHAFGYEFANVSPAPRELELERHGLRLLHPDVAFAHVFPDGRSLEMHASLDDTCASIAAISPPDADAWRALFSQWTAAKDAIVSGFNQPPARSRGSSPHTRAGRPRPVPVLVAVVALVGE